MTNIWDIQSPHVVLRDSLQTHVPSGAHGLRVENHFYTGRLALQEDPHAVESQVYPFRSLMTVIGKIRYLKDWPKCLGLHG